MGLRSLRKIEFYPFKIIQEPTKMLRASKVAVSGFDVCGNATTNAALRGI